MTEMPSGRHRQTFMGSQLSGAEIIFYPHTERLDAEADGILPIDLITGRLELSRRTAAQSRTGLRLINFHSTSQLGAAAAQASFQVKASDPRALDALEDLIVADDWLDVVLSVHDRDYHTMRARVATVTRTEDASSGATQRTLDFTIDSFGSVLALTPLYYDIVSDGLIAAAAYARVLFGRADAQALPYRVDQAVKKLLYGFLVEFGALGRAPWTLPQSMPERFIPPEATTFPQSTLPRDLVRHLGFFPDMDARAFVDDPPRFHIGTFSWGTPDGESLWQVLQQWADLAICELWTDLVHPSGRYLTSDDALRPGETAMAVILRDKPFPTGSRLGETLSTGPWFDTGDRPRIVTFEADERTIASKRVGRNGMLRKNAFFIAPALPQSLGSLARILQRPRWDPEDIAVHGLRRWEPQTQYIQRYDENLPVEAQSGTILGVAEVYRKRIRDFHCLDHHLLTGTIDFTLGRPDIRVGHKLRITSDDPSRDETYYVEEVSHRWSLEPGLRTTVTVSRGWRGSELGGRDSLANTLQRTFARYIEPRLAPVLGPET